MCVQQGLLFYTLDQKTTAEREAQAKDKRLNLYLMGQRRLFSFLERACCSCCYCSYCFPPKYILLTHTHTLFLETVCTLVDTHSAGRKSVKGFFFFSFLLCEKGKILSGSKRGTFAVNMSPVLVPGYFLFCIFFPGAVAEYFSF